jgi:hypothetical protein
MKHQNDPAYNDSSNPKIFHENVSTVLKLYKRNWIDDPPPQKKNTHTSVKFGRWMLIYTSRYYHGISLHKLRKTIQISMVTDISVVQTRFKPVTVCTHLCDKVAYKGYVSVTT